MPLDWHGAEFMQRVRHASLLAVEAGVIVLQREVKAQLSKGGSSNRGNEGKRIGGKHLAVGTGNLRRSIQVGEISTDGRRTTTRVFTNTAYARIHEFGGVITARKRALTIPVSRKAKAAAARGVRPQQAFPDSFIISTGKGGKGLIVRDTTRGKTKIGGVAKAGNSRPTVLRKPSMGKRGGKHDSHVTMKLAGKNRKLEVLYVLVRSVRIPPRPFFRPAITEAKTKVRDVMQRAFKAKMRI